MLYICHEPQDLRSSQFLEHVHRLDLIGEKNGAAVYVDYAHTPDALEQVLKALRKHTSGKLKVLFGCGGNRDKGKRPIMGQIADFFIQQDLSQINNSLLQRRSANDTIYSRTSASFYPRSSFTFSINTNNTLRQYSILCASL